MVAAAVGYGVSAARAVSTRRMLLREAELAVPEAGRLTDEPQGPAHLRAALAQYPTLEMASFELDVDKALLWRWAHGERVPTLRQAVRLMRKLNIPVTDWVAEEEDDVG